MFTSQPNDFIIIISAHQRVSERKMINPHTHTHYNAEIESFTFTEIESEDTISHSLTPRTCVLYSWYSNKWKEAKINMKHRLHRRQFASVRSMWISSVSFRFGFVFFFFLSFLLFVTFLSFLYIFVALLQFSILRRY